MTSMGQLILDVIVRPFFAIWITLAVNYEKGGFQLEFVSISWVINHMTCYNSSALIGKFILKKILYKICSPVWML